MQTDFARQPQWRKRFLRGLAYKIYQKQEFVKQTKQMSNEKYPCPKSHLVAFGKEN